MAFLPGFRSADGELFVGNLLMLSTSVLYLAWWSLAFWPKSAGKPGAAPLVLGLALSAGLAGLVVLGLGILSASSSGGGPRIAMILAGAVAAYFLLLFATKTFFGRIVTSELLVMVVWAAAELLALNALLAMGRLGAAGALSLSAAVLAATGIGVVCYVLYYRLDAYASFWDGLVPLGVDGLATLAIIAAQAFSRKA
jgi:hypothetical protein